MRKLQYSDILVFGAFGKTVNSISGQTVKTRHIHNLLMEKLNKPIPFCDTIELKTNWIKTFKFLYLLIKARILVYLPAINSLRYLFPILYMLSKILGYEIHYFVIGGWLPNMVKQDKLLAERLTNIAMIYVETFAMFNLLTQDYKFRNVVWFPNFRAEYQSDKINRPSEKLRIVFISRITMEKGIDTIFSFLELIEGSQLLTKLTIDFYGPIEPSIKRWFFAQVAKNQIANYLGQVPPDQVQSIISNYDLMIFPTRYSGEGCPGAIIDAYMAKVPVLASHWKYNSEFVDDGVTGYLFNPDDINCIREIITNLVDNRTLLLELGRNAKIFATRFTKANAWEIICKAMNLK